MNGNQSCSRQLVLWESLHVCKSQKRELTLSHLGLRMPGESSLALHPKSYYLKVKRTLGQLTRLMRQGKKKKTRVQGSLGSESVAAQLSAIPVLHSAEGNQAMQPLLQSGFLRDFQVTVKLHS